ncbi:MAG TPA: glycosyltransferase [Thermoanaerobaculia bacterium]|nr:glycosyltransferase [Thermoanaerobaculia bacterium]
MPLQSTTTNVAPRVSVIVAAFDAHETLERCLASLRAQTFRDFEVILVDSSPGEESARIASAFPEVRFDRSASRLYPHEARNRAVAQARGVLLVSIDADCYAHRECLAELVREYDASAQVIVGAIACHGRRLRDLGMHFCKFAKFLPGGAVRAIDTAPTANLLVARADFEQAGGMHGGQYLADVSLGQALEAMGRELRFAPRAVVEHHHTDSIARFLRERYLRGGMFGRLRTSWLTTRRSVALYFIVSILPVRLARIAALTYRYCAAANMRGAFLLTWPLAFAGHAAWLAGESLAYARELVRFRARRPSARNNGAALARTTRWGPQ